MRGTTTASVFGLLFLLRATAELMSGDPNWLAWLISGTVFVAVAGWIYQTEKAP